MTTEHDKLVEDCARAICDDDVYAILWANLSESDRDKFRSEARAALAIAVARCAAVVENCGAYEAINGNMVRSDFAIDVANAIRALLSPNAKEPS